DKIHCSFILGGVEYMRKSGYIGKLAYKLFSSLNMRPSLKVSDDRFGVDRIWAGNLKKNYMSYLHHALPRTADPDLNVLFVTYAVLSEDDLVWIGEEIRKIAAFKHIIFQKASAAISLNCGPGTFGLLYMDKGRRAWHMDPILQAGDISRDADEEMGEETDNELVTDDSLSAATDSEEPLWYETIDGIDGKTAVKNSGSESSFKTVLQIFYDSVDSKASEIEGYYVAEDWNNYKIKVHALKSSAKLIGAMELSDAAQLLETAGKKGDIDYIREHHASLMRDYKKMGGRLAGIYGEGIQEAPENKAKPLADEFLLESVYEGLKEAADSMDCDAIDEILSELSDYEVPVSDRNKLYEIRKKAEAFDYEGILNLLESH
ncbi:MAG: Hpt domain-containing protein, partial [Lachnospiraceae bacterium]|nr:Hpt domain-containing protein [Lachnospiraceae bacterium]